MLNSSLRQHCKLALMPRRQRTTAPPPLPAGMMITTLVSYLSHSQVWALQQSGALHIGGRTNRATSSFQDELSKMLDMVPERAVASFGQDARSQGTLEQLPAEEQAEEGPEPGPAPEMMHDDIANMATGSSVGR